MRRLVVVVALTGFVFSAIDIYAARRQETEYPTVAKDQSRPARSAPSGPGAIPSHMEDDPCTIDPSWCDGGSDESVREHLPEALSTGFVRHQARRPEVHFPPVEGGGDKV